MGQTIAVFLPIGHYQVLHSGRVVIVITLNRVVGRFMIGITFLSCPVHWLFFLIVGDRLGIVRS